MTIELQPPDWQVTKIILRQNGQVVFRPELLARATQALQARVAEHPVVICSQKGLAPAQTLTEEVGPWRNARLVAGFDHYTAEMVVKRRTRKATVVFAPPAAES